MSIIEDPIYMYRKSLSIANGCPVALQSYKELSDFFSFLSSEQSNSGRTAVTQTQSLDRHKFTLQLPDFCLHHADLFPTFL